MCWFLKLLIFRLIEYKKTIKYQFFTEKTYYFYNWLILGVILPYFVIKYFIKLIIALFKFLRIILKPSKSDKIASSNLSLFQIFSSYLFPLKFLPLFQFFLKSRIPSRKSAKLARRVRSSDWGARADDVISRVANRLAALGPVAAPGHWAG